MAYSLSISITQNSQSVANNTSNVTVKVNCSWNAGTWSAENLYKYCTINGTKYEFSSTDINPNATTSGSSTLFTKTLDIAHNADGTGKVDVYASTKTTTSSGTQTASASKTLTTIARKSSVSATNEYIEDNCLITISRKSSSFTHTLKYTFGSLSGTIATKTSSTSVNFLLPQSFYAQLGSTATQKSGTITCETFNGSTSLGTASCSFTAYANKQNCHPTLNGAKVTPDTRTQTLTGNAKTIIRYVTDAAVTIGAAARLSATLTEKSVTNAGKKLTADGTFTGVTSGDFAFYAKDSRGYTHSYTEKLSVIPYIKLTCNMDVRIGVDGTATVSIKGNYFDDTFGASNNFLTPQFRYKVQGGTYSSWMYCSPSFNGATYTAVGEDWGLDYSTTYVFQARATDAIGTVTTQEIEVKAEPLFDWGENDFRFNVPVTYEGYNLSGIAKAMRNSYNLDVIDSTAGANWTVNEKSAYLVGNGVRCYFYATRNSSTGVGDISNETVLTFKIKHNGKIRDAFNMSFPNGAYGQVVSFVTANMTRDDVYLTFDVKISAATGLSATNIATGVTSTSSYFTVPVTIYPENY